MASGFLRSFESEMAKYTDATPIFHRACAATVFGALLTRQEYRCTVAGGAKPKWLNLWTILIGDSARSHKSTAIDMASEVLTRVDQNLWAPDSGSPEGFLHDLKDRGMDPSLIIVRSEFSTLLQHFQKSYANDFKSTLMDFYDVPLIHKKRLAKSTFIVNSPRVSLLGGIATELMPSLTRPADWQGGFFNRCMIVGGEKVKHFALERTVPPRVYDRVGERLLGMLEDWREFQKGRDWPTMTFSPDAEAILKKVPEPPDEPNVGLALGRAGAHLKKLAAIEQIDEDIYSKIIKGPAVRRAFEFLMAWWEGLPDIVDACCARGREDLEGDRLEKRIHRYVLKKGGHSTVREVLRNCALKTKNLNEALSALQESGLITLEAGPRDHTVIHAIKTSEAAAED